MHGAGHESGRRAGTENVLLDVGLGAAAELAADLTWTDGVREQRDRLWSDLQSAWGERVVLNGHPTKRLPNTLNVSFVRQRRRGDPRGHARGRRRPPARPATPTRYRALAGPGGHGRAPSRSAPARSASVSGRMTTHDELATLVERLAEVLPADGGSRPKAAAVDHLRFGTFLAPNIMPVYQAVTEEVGRRLGIETELVVETDYEACANDENEVCFVCSLPYVEFERQGISPAVPIAAPVLDGRPLRRQAHLLLGRHRPPRTVRSGRSSTCVATPGPTTSRSRTRATGSRATTWSSSERPAGSSARSSRRAFTRSRSGWWPHGRSTPPPSTLRCWP